MGKLRARYSPEVIDRALHMVTEHEYSSQRAAITPIALKIGSTSKHFADLKRIMGNKKALTVINAKI